MHSHRRDFLRVLAAAGSTAAFGARASGEQEAAPAETVGLDPSSVTFWTQHFLRPPSATLGPENADARTPRFFVYTQKDGFRVPTSPPVKPEELGKFDRPSVRLRLISFKPSLEDSHKFDTSQSGTLRVDVLEEGMLNSGQTGASGAAQPEAKASTAVSSLAVSGQAKLQPNSIKGLAIGDQEAVTLAGGGGFLNWTFFLQQKEAVWHRILAIILKLSTTAATSFAPVLKLAAVPKETWTGINTVVGALFPAPNSTQNTAKSTIWLFNPTLVALAASQKAFQEPAFADGLPLIKGAYYVVVPQAHYQDFGTPMSNMMLSQGYVVPKNTPPQSVFEAAYNMPELKNVSYLIFHCEEITEAPAGCGSASRTP
jgi:hypothetical protein